jgi:uracil-DNA glycosylase
MSAAPAQAALDAIAEEIRTHDCDFEPCRTATNFVPGEGDPQAGLVLVGEAPGAKEDAAGRPFVGAAGKLLDRLLEGAGLDRGEVFITNVLKARPPGNRDPRPAEVAHCMPWLERQLEAIDPCVVALLGRHALAALQPELRVREDHGRPVAAGRRWYLPLYHPAAALRVRPLRETLRADVERIPELLGRGRP